MNAQELFEDAKKDLAAKTAAAKKASPDRLVAAAHEVQTAVGYLCVIEQYAQFDEWLAGMSGYERATQLHTWLLGILLRGADDTFSGRGNDGARARFDGIRKAGGTIEMQIRLRLTKDLEAAATP